MKSLVEETIEYLKKSGVDYADVRYVGTRAQNLSVKNEKVEGLSESISSGIGIRVLKNGSWGFAASSGKDNGRIESTADRALEVSESAAAVNTKKIKLASEEVYVDSWKSSYEKDPFEVGLNEKLDLLFSSVQTMRGDGRIRSAEGSLSLFRENKVFGNTEGSLIDQSRIDCGGGISAVAYRDGEFQRRSYPCSFRGNHASRGYEFIEELKLRENADRVREEVVELLDAPECPAGKTDVIILSSQLALQIHESCGHPIELDRVLGAEISLAGGSFLSTDKLGDYRYGSEIVNITADATVPDSIASFGYDDEGVRAQRTTIVDKGIFKGYLTSRETAPELGLKSNGSMRAAGWNNIPLIRMININLEPGRGGLEDLIADTKDGIMIDSNKSWSIDDLRLNFQFGCEIGWRIKNGKVAGMIKNPVYTGRTPDFWNSCDAVCGNEDWVLWGLPTCGKGEPMQTARVGHGTAPARFRNVEVGVKK